MSVERPAPTPLAVRASTAAQLMDCSRGHIYQLCERGVLRRVTVEGSNIVRIPVADINAALGLGGGDEAA